MAEAQVSEEVVTPVEPEITPAQEAPTVPPSTEEPIFTEEELNAILNPPKKEETPTEPVLFEEKKDNEESTDNLSILSESLDQMIEELTTSDQEKAEKDKLIQEATAKAQEYEEQIKGIEELYDKVQSVIGSDTAQALALGDMEKVPLHFIPENWKRVESHPVIGPLVAPLLKGEAINVPGFLKSLAESRRAAMPATTSTLPSAPVTEEKVNPLQEALKVKGW